MALQKKNRTCHSGSGGHKCHRTKHPTTRKRSVQPTTEDEVLRDENSGTFWMGSVTIGTPGQSFDIDFDTGGSHTFDSQLSSTYKFWNKEFYIQYGDGSSASGTWSNDAVTFGSISIANQPFAIINSANGMNTGKFDGILGMAYQKISSCGENPVIWTMYLAGELSLPIFSFWFDSVSTGYDTGELILGGYDASKYTGNFTYAPVSVEGYWEFVADSVSLSIGSTTTTIATSISAILDTGTTDAILGPSAYVNAINSMLEATYDPTIGYYTVDCQTKSLAAFPNITVTISGVPFTLTTLMYIQIAGGPIRYTCYLVISSLKANDADSNPIWILGDFFMRHFYNIFDMQNNRIGLALSTSYSVVQTVPNSLFPSTGSVSFPTPVTAEYISLWLNNCISTSSDKNHTRILLLLKLVAITETLPPQCYNYTTISDATRLTTAPAGESCDSTLFNNVSSNIPTYVRFISPGGTRLAGSAPNSAQGNACGTYVTGWTNATYPSFVGQTVNAFIGFAYHGTPNFAYIYIGYQ
ncbi:unnamed protein product [Rotaria socialis]|uniref:Peptidase A1 domain-containing protein n=1 Tax=Rotaria socialis TaxID=392032 RepID=A0A817XLZ2_9BILA|nr:unnamed protein product [Rotaria socialis]